MARLNIQNIKGVPPYTIYVSDQYFNNKTLIAIIDPDSPTQQNFNVPSIFEGLDKLMVIISDNSGCDYCNFFKLLECRYGCALNIIIEPISCSFEIKIDQKECQINKLILR